MKTYDKKSDRFTKERRIVMQEFPSPENDLRQFHLRNYPMLLTSYGCVNSIHATFRASADVSEVVGSSIGRLDVRPAAIGLNEPEKWFIRHHSANCVWRNSMAWCTEAPLTSPVIVNACPRSGLGGSGGYRSHVVTGGARERERPILSVQRRAWTYALVDWQVRVGGRQMKSDQHDVFV